MSPGAMLLEAWDRDPKRLAFTFARYKHVAKMLNGKQRVLEVGADSGFMSRVVQQHVGSVTCVDLTTGTDYTKTHLLPQFDAIYALDVLEHVEEEDAFMVNVCASLKDHGTCIIGMPSLESQVYASPPSKAGHVNCKTEDGLRDLMEDYFHNVYLFGIQDETLHTGFGPMCQYRLALANTPRRK